MGDEINWLVTVLYGGTLLRCALQIKRDALPGDCAEFPMEPENRNVIHGFLPLHVQTCGPIVAVEELFEVHVYNKTPAFPTEHAREAHTPDKPDGGEGVEKEPKPCRRHHAIIVHKGGKEYMGCSKCDWISETPFSVLPESTAPGKEGG